MDIKEEAKVLYDHITETYAGYGNCLGYIQGTLEEFFEASKQERDRKIIEKLEKRYLEVTESGYDGMRVTGWRDAIDYLIENLSK